MTHPAPAAARPSRTPRLHIGHHFFGSGNLGDDLMLAGFLQAVGPGVGLTCCSACDVESQRRRFPQVRWLPYSMEAREAAVRECDAWVGVGDTPFQLSVGPWFLEHLRGELDFCRRAGKPMYFVGVGVSETDALRDERGRAVLDYASRVWARDAWSADALSAACDPVKVRLGADLAHAYFHHHPPPRPPEPDVVGYVLNFEDPSQFTREALCAAVAATPPAVRQRWLVQEVRTLSGSEMELWETLPDACRRRLELRKPNYSNDAMGDLLASWGAPGRVLSSRYHGSLIGAWAGAGVVAIERSGKMKGLVSELDIRSLPALHDAAAVHAALDAAAPVPMTLLHALAARAAAGCAELLGEVG